MDTAFDNLKFEIQEDSHAPTRIKVIGIGGAGSNAVSRIVEQGPEGAEYYILNTDHRALDASPVANKHLLGAKTTGGRGTGANPTVGRQSALDDTEAILEILDGADLVIIAAGLGGGTGTGAAPVIASLAREMNALTIGIVTRPFSFEGPRKMEVAEKGLEELSQVLDNVLIVPNDRLLDIAPRGTSFKDALRMVDDVLAQTVNGIGDIVLRPGVINRDFSDVKATLSGMGTVRLGSATAEGADNVVDAARRAIECPMLDAHGIAGARVVLLHVMGSPKLQLHDVYDATEFIRKAANNPDLHVNLGLSLDEAFGDKVKVTVIATSFDEALAASYVPHAAAALPVAPPTAVPAALPQRQEPPTARSTGARPVPTAQAPAKPQAAPTVLREVPRAAAVASVEEAVAAFSPAPIPVAAQTPEGEISRWRGDAPVDETRETPTADALEEEPELDYRFVAPGLYDGVAAVEGTPAGASPLFGGTPAEPQAAEPDSNLFDLDDLETPAYLRQGHAPRV